MSSKSRKKLLLMGKSGSGKTSMRAIIFKSQLAADTRRLSATIDVESSQIRFLGGLRLDLWDCGGQDSFMDSHLTSQSSTVFRSVHSLIYIFDAESPDLLTHDTHYFLKCLSALSTQTSSSSTTSSSNSATPLAAPASTSSGTNEDGVGGENSGPMVFVLLHKMDLVPIEQQQTKFQEFEREVGAKARESGWKGGLKFMATSIWNETLYRAWSIVVSHLMPSLSLLRHHLESYLSLTSSLELVLFERTTFLVISSVTKKLEDMNEEEKRLVKGWEERRFERVSTMVKGFKGSCNKLHLPFTSLSLSSTNYTTLLDALTPETYLLIVAPRNSTNGGGGGGATAASVELNLKGVREFFGGLEGIGAGSSNGGK
ncbi:Rag GTPase GTR1 [Sporobolomyces salmoneus]|uniref:Rag GTPase GTR1 n=1 Tax=Sporobolomyces salmoneus TaxID=183962 RepID=UPI00316CBC34